MEWQSVFQMSQMKNHGKTAADNSPVIVRAQLPLSNGHHAFLGAAARCLASSHSKSACHIFLSAAPRSAMAVASGRCWLDTHKPRIR